MDGGPWLTIALVIIYLYITKSIGPKFMKNRKPFNLRTLIFIYNLFLIFFNLYIFYNGFFLTNYGLESFRCKKLDRQSKNPEEFAKIYFGWLYFISKFVDFGDTFFFVLRKKDRQLSFLHLYHHSMMPIFSWMGLKYVPGSNTAFLPLINSFVHIIMYSYYALSTFPEFRPYLWWKKYLTSLQLVQFVFIIIHSFYSIIVPSCEWPKIFIYLSIINAMLFFHLFYSFYKKTYTKSKC